MIARGCSFTDNAGLCGIPGLPTCGSHLSAGAIIGIGLGTAFAFLILVTCSVCWWKRRQNILRAQQIAGKDVHHLWVRLSKHFPYIFQSNMIQSYYQFKISLDTQWCLTLTKKKMIKVSKLALYIQAPFPRKPN